LVLPSSQVSSSESAPLPHVAGIVGQTPLTATQRPAEQQPSAHALSEQQMSPRPPHLAHTPSAPLLAQAVPA
jgi:hypothetical protein